MSTPIRFRLYDAATGALLTGAKPVLSSYVRSGAEITPPAITEPVPYLYEFTPSDADEAAGVDYVIDGVTSEPRRLSGSIDPVVSDAGAGSELLTVTVRDALAALLPGALVYAHNQAGALVGSGTSDALGVVVLSPGPGTHTLTVRYAGLVFAATSVTITPATNQTAAIAGTVSTPPAAASPDRCAVYADLEYGTGLPVAGVVGVATLSGSPQVISGHYVSDWQVSATSDAAGRISWDLPRGGVYSITIPRHVTAKVITVPAAASAALSGL